PRRCRWRTDRAQPDPDGGDPGEGGMRRKNFATMAARGQRGVVLAVVLVLLVVMSLLAVASLGGTLLEERMSSAQFDRALALQAAEAAMREAEELARGKPALPASGCKDGVCATPDPTDPTESQRWLNAGFWDDGSGNYAEATVSVGDLAVKPRYIVELMDNNVPNEETCTTSGDVSLEAACMQFESRYRITVRSADDDR